MATNNTRKNIPHFDIFEYWKDKAILADGQVVSVREAMDKKLVHHPVILDWGEPCCWACGKPVISDYEKNRDGEMDYTRLWNDGYVKSKLHRCHVVPHALGGECTPTNLFLMCESCHELSPDTVNRETFFRWVYDQRETHTMGFLSPKVVVERAQEILTRRGIGSKVEDLAKQIGSERLSFDELREYMKSHIGSHWNHYADTSILNGLIDWLIHKYLETVLA